MPIFSQQASGDYYNFEFKYYSDFTHTCVRDPFLVGVSSGKYSNSYGAGLVVAPPWSPVMRINEQRKIRILKLTLSLYGAAVPVGAAALRMVYGRMTALPSSCPSDILDTTHRAYMDTKTQAMPVNGTWNDYEPNDYLITNMNDDINAYNAPTNPCFAVGLTAISGSEGDIGAVASYTTNPAQAPKIEIEWQYSPLNPTI